MAQVGYLEDDIADRVGSIEEVVKNEGEWRVGEDGRGSSPL